MRPAIARHHHCPIDLDHRDIYSGDNFGVSYRNFDTAAGAFVIPTTTPVQFDPDALHRTIDRLLSYQPRRILQTHFGPVTEIARLAADMHAGIDDFVRIARSHAGAPIVASASLPTCSNCSTGVSTRTAMRAIVPRGTRCSTTTCV
jgi:hypothetical protein